MEGKRDDGGGKDWREKLGSRDWREGIQREELGKKDWRDWRERDWERGTCGRWRDWKKVRNGGKGLKLR